MHQGVPLQTRFGEVVQLARAVRDLLHRALLAQLGVVLEVEVDPGAALFDSHAARQRGRLLGPVA